MSELRRGVLPHMRVCPRGAGLLPRLRPSSFQCLHQAAGDQQSEADLSLVGGSPNSAGGDPDTDSGIGASSIKAFQHPFDGKLLPPRPSWGSHVLFTSRPLEILLQKRFATGKAQTYAEEWRRYVGIFQDASERDAGEDPD
jgi:hypothetical protein